VPDLIDYFSIDKAAMRRIAALHLFVNIAAFAINLWSRFALPSTSAVPLPVAEPLGQKRLQPERWKRSAKEIDDRRVPVVEAIRMTGNRSALVLSGCLSEHHLFEG
jgi:hypothetical protein